jgi:hypothetical protein
MAGIDKIECSNWSDYQELIEWANGKSIIFTVGNKHIIKYVSNYIYELTEDEANSSCCVMNNPPWLDNYLWNNCPIAFVRKRLMYQYNKESLDEFLIAEIGKLPANFQKVKKIKIIRSVPTSTPLNIAHSPSMMLNKYKKKITNCWDLSISHKNTKIRSDYSEFFKCFLPSKLFPTSCNIEDGFSTIREVIRFVKKMYLPPGTVLYLSGRYTGENYLIKIITI